MKENQEQPPIDSIESNSMSPEELGSAIEEELYQLNENVQEHQELIESTDLSQADEDSLTSIDGKYEENFGKLKALGLGGLVLPMSAFLGGVYQLEMDPALMELTQQSVEQGTQMAEAGMVAGSVLIALAGIGYGAKKIKSFLQTRGSYAS